MNFCRSGVIRKLNLLQNHLQYASHSSQTFKQRFEAPVISENLVRSMSQSHSSEPRKDLPVSAFELTKLINNGDVDDAYPLTKSEALSFLEQVLKLPNPEELCKKDKIAFLHTVTERMNKAIPYSNVVLMGRAVHLRVAPSLEECKQEVMARRGGSCFIVNTFNKALLEHMGYTCHHVPGNDPVSKYTGTHAGLIMVDLRYPGSVDIVEVGTRRPLFDPIPTEFDMESPEYQFGHMRSKFFREDGLVAWYKEIDKDSTRKKNVIFRGGKKWEKQMAYDVNTRVPLSALVKVNNVVWPSAKIVPEVHGDVLCTGYSGLEFVSIRGKYVSIIDENLIERTKVSKSKEELVGVFQEYFPQFTEEMVLAAIDNTIKSW